MASARNRKNISNLIGIILIIAVAMSIWQFVVIPAVQATNSRNKIINIALEEMRDGTAKIYWGDLFSTKSLKMTDVQIDKFEQLFFGTRLPWAKEKLLYGINLRIQIVESDGNTVRIDIFADKGNDKVYCTVRAGDYLPLSFSLEDSGKFIVGLAQGLAAIEK